MKSSKKEWNSLKCAFDKFLLKAVRNLTYQNPLIKILKILQRNLKITTTKPPLKRCQRTKKISETFCLWDLIEKLPSKFLVKKLSMSLILCLLTIHILQLTLSREKNFSFILWKTFFPSKWMPLEPFSWFLCRWRRKSERKLNFSAKNSSAIHLLWVLSTPDEQRGRGEGFPECQEGT